jgi:UDP-N-acetylglucosamine 2-epimerase (non-hydrolysing)
MNKILVVLGTRPEAIKMAPVVWELARYEGRLPYSVCVTGQHREMLDQTLQAVRIVPDFDLGVMIQNQSSLAITRSVLDAFERILREEQPGWVLVQGDTTTCAAISLACFYMKVRVAHIEAGLRSFNRSHPYPEEGNRIIADHLADRHFAATEQAKSNLLREGIPADSVIVTGNTVIDTLLWASRKKCDLKHVLPADIEKKKIILVTAHRRESFGQPLESICKAIVQIAQRNPQVHVVYPVHLNPNVREPVYRLLSGQPNIALIPPLEYLPFVHLMKRSHIILTDSGGIQEEAPALGVPVLVLREVTERVEVVELGAAKMVGLETEKIVHEAERLLADGDEYRRMVIGFSPYGDGAAGRRIVSHLAAAVDSDD